ncbi:MAG: DUF268 domain-containing protein [Thermodesulfobacteriota bacterium]|nr:DUF268 domain-containing protein [Thermodesulfobacteriota bacterium]
MTAEIFSMFQGKTSEEVDHIINFLEQFPEDELPLILKLLKAINYKAQGSLTEFNRILLNFYKDNGDAVSYWYLVNDLRIIHHHILPADRPKVLTNIIDGRIGRGLLPNTDSIAFLPGQELTRIKTSIITYRPYQDNFIDILRNLPVGWEPDYVLYFLSETLPMLPGLEKSPFPVIGLPGDPFGINKLCWDMKFFDALVPAIHHMCASYEKTGNAHVFYRSCSGIQGYVPWQSYSTNESEKEYDVVATGSYTNPVYRKRNQYMWRLLNMADKFKIFVGRTETVQESYEIMTKAKMVFHCPSLQGGINLRVFEAVASGALLLHEKDDLSIEEFFESGNEVALFDETNFEETITYYLTHEEERKNMVSRAMGQNKNHLTITQNMKNVLDEIKSRNITVSHRDAQRLTDDEKLNAFGISSFYAKDYHRATMWFSKALQMKENNPKYINNLAVCLMAETTTQEHNTSTIEQLLLLACEADRSSIISRFNTISFYGFIEPHQQNFITWATNLINDIINNTQKLPQFAGEELIFSLDKPLNGFPDSSIFQMELEWLLMSYPDRGPEYKDNFYRILLWRTLEYLGDYYVNMDHRDKAIESYKSALHYEPRNEIVLKKLATVFMKNGILQEAEDALHKLLSLSPLHEEAHLALSEVESALGKKNEMETRISRLLHVNGLQYREKFLFFLEQSQYRPIVQPQMETNRLTKPPENIPESLCDQFTMNGKIKTLYWYFNNSYPPEKPVRFETEQINQFLKQISNRNTFYYGITDYWLYQALECFKIAHKNTVIMGSNTAWYESICLYFGGKCTTIEYNTIISDDPRLTFLTPGEYDKNPIQFDCGFSISSFEHDGLGRYGDPIDPDGDVNAMKKMKHILKPNGLLFLAVPLGKDTLVWNAHRIYGRIRLPLLLNNWELIASFGMVNELIDHDWGTAHGPQPILVLKNTPA